MTSSFPGILPALQTGSALACGERTRSGKSLAVSIILLLFLARSLRDCQLFEKKAPPLSGAGKGRHETETV